MPSKEKESDTSVVPITILSDTSSDDSSSEEDMQCVERKIIPSRLRRPPTSSKKIFYYSSDEEVSSEEELARELKNSRAPAENGSSANIKPSRLDSSLIMDKIASEEPTLVSVSLNCAERLSGSDNDVKELSDFQNDPSEASSQTIFPQSVEQDAQVDKLEIKLKSSPSPQQWPLYVVLIVGICVGVLLQRYILFSPEIHT